MHKTKKDEEKKKIMEENLRIIRNIQQKRTSIPTLLELEKEMEENEVRRSRLRKAKSKSIF